jgi:hypothetical protein
LKIEHNRIINLYRIFGNSNNTGLYFSDNKQKCRIIGLRDAHFKDHGRIGTIIDVRDNFYLLKTLGGAIWIRPEVGKDFIEIIQNLQ